MQMHTYRPDVDGLRAIAVLAVVAFHAFPNRLAGGFVGVDVFFVISGYLITGIIQADLASGRFSALDFYARRVRRIFPALILVLLATIAAGWRILTPTDYALLGKHTIAGGLFSSNLLLWREAGYFDTASELKPFLHLWSLGVEEQFYLLWPLALAALSGLRHRTVLIVAVACASFAVNGALSSGHPEAAFYLPFSRFWELMIGAALASRAATLGSGSSAAGLVLILISAVFMPAAGYPGWHALAPTVGTALVILGGPAARLNRLIAARPILYIGLISYPLYLWHWPLLALLRNYNPDHVSSMQKIGVVLVSLILAALTYHCVEKPLKKQSFRKVAAALALAMAAPLVFGATLWGSGGARDRWTAAQLSLIDDARLSKEQLRRDSRLHACLLDHDQQFKDFAPECRVENAAAVLWGDSHAAHLVFGLRTVAISQLTSTLCPPILGYRSKKRPHCEATNQAIFESLQAPTTVILSAEWDEYLGEEKLIAHTLQKLRERGHHVILVGPSPSFSVEPLTVFLHEGVRNYVKSGNMELLRTTEGRLSAIAARLGAVFVPMLDKCGPEGCMVLEDRRLVYVDADHFSRLGAAIYGSRVIAALPGSTAAVPETL
jgi:peptidoglycan/LPS O-acetylase OafA/YrhL